MLEDWPMMDQSQACIHFTAEYFGRHFLLRFWILGRQFLLRSRVLQHFVMCPDQQEIVEAESFRSFLLESQHLSI